MNNFFWVFISFVIVQRLVELFISKRNENLRLQRGAIEYDKTGYLVIVSMHTLFFISLLLETAYLNRILNQFWIVFFAIFVIAQALRYWAIISLGEYWNTKIIVSHGSKLISKGPYRYFRHPNYAAVVLELACIPLIFSCYVTSAVFSILNIIVLARRIRIEESALKNASG